MGGGGERDRESGGEGRSGEWERGLTEGDKRSRRRGRGGGGRVGRRVDETVRADLKQELDSRATATLYIKCKVLSLDAIHKEHRSKIRSYA